MTLKDRAYWEGMGWERSSDDDENGMKMDSERMAEASRGDLERSSSHDRPRRTRPVVLRHGNKKLGKLTFISAPFAMFAGDHSYGPSACTRSCNCCRSSSSSNNKTTCSTRPSSTSMVVNTVSGRKSVDSVISELTLRQGLCNNLHRHLPFSEAAAAEEEEEEGPYPHQSSASARPNPFVSSCAESIQPSFDATSHLPINTIISWGSRARSNTGLMISSGLYVKIRSSDMPISMQMHAIQLTKEILEKQQASLMEAAKALKQSFDDHHGYVWHCIVGPSFGSYVTHTVGTSIYFSVGKLAVLLFKTSLLPPRSSTS